MEEQLLEDKTREMKIGQKGFSKYLMCCLVCKDRREEWRVSWNRG